VGEIKDFHFQQFNNLFVRGQFRDLISLRKSLGGTPPSVFIAKLELISLLSLGKERRALKLLIKYSSQFNFGDDFIALFKRFVFRDSLNAQINHTIHSNREVLEVYFSKKSTPSYIDKISRFENIVVISNNSNLLFSDKEKSLLRGLSKPLFVYLNIGNPSVADIRDEIYGSDVAELLIGGHHHVVDADSKLIFTPYDKSFFLGCLVRVNSRFQRLWHERLALKAVESNFGINFFELDEALLIDSLYPLSTYYDSANALRKRIPSIGWMALTLLDAIIQSKSGARARLWMAGFSLTPAYVFHVAGNLQQHDFSFEKQALEFRLSQKEISSLGSISSEAIEMNAQQHLERYGFQGQQLSKFMRSKSLL